LFQIVGWHRQNSSCTWLLELSNEFGVDNGVLATVGIHAAHDAHGQEQNEDKTEGSPDGCLGTDDLVCGDFGDQVAVGVRCFLDGGAYGH